jgi:DNA-binding NarL/FixJ family response regulator
MNGMSIMQHRRVQESSLPVVIISGEDNSHIIKLAINSGAMGFIPKAYSGQEMLAGLRSILRGELFVPDGIRFRREYPVSGIRRDRGIDEEIPCAGITRRQHEVLRLLASGHSNKQISSKLFLTENTVKAHVSALLRICGASNRTECVNIARQIGII